MRWVSIGVVLAIGACGRFGFSEEQQAGDPDGSIPDAAAPDASDVTPLISCEEPARFQVGAAGFTAIEAVATSTGFALFTFATGGTISGWAYEWSDLGLVNTAQNVTIGADLTATFGAAALGDDVLLVAVTDTGETRIYPLTNRLASRGTPTQVVEPAGIAPIAVNGAGNGLVVATINPTSGDGELREVSAAGALGLPVSVAPGAESPGSLSVRPAADGFVVSYSAAASSPNDLTVVLANGDGVTKGPVVANVTTFDPLRPQVLWAPESNVYLVSWFEKNVDGDDDIWVQVLDSTLTAVTVPQVIADFSVDPKITTDGTDFWVTWRSYSTSLLESARISPTGTVTAMPVATSGGTAKNWAVLARAGQPVLAWTETNGSGPDLWLTALCE